MSQTSKGLSERDFQQALRSAYNQNDASFTTASFVTGAVGRKIEQSVDTTNVLNDSLVFTYSENGITLYVLKTVYTDASYSTFMYVERIA
jgi:hypothetical protein